MRFVVKDLMITVLPVDYNDLMGPPVSCDGGCSCCSGCTGNTNQTHGETCNPEVLPEMELSLDHLAAVKEQLRGSLAAIEAREEAVKASLRPRTASEVELVRRHLSEALDELDSINTDDSASEG